MEDPGETPEEKLQKKHKEERKTLQGKIQQLKHSAPKGDKKRKKEVQIQIAQLEAELDEKHEAELKQLQESSPAGVSLNDAIAKVSISEENAAACDDATSSGSDKKKSKAQKRRDKKEAADRERDQRIKKQEVENLSGARHIESKKLKATLKVKGFQLYEIPSDGNCLYAAIVHQLRSYSREETVNSLRKHTAAYMRKNAADFLPFLCKTDTGDPYTEDEFEAYCSVLETTPAWGGQLEIKALSSVLQRPLEVIQADAPPVISGEEYNDKTILLPYFRHAFGLGEHYNSVQILTDIEEEDR